MNTAVSTAVSSAVSSAFAAQSATHAQHAQHAAPLDYGAAQATIVQHKQTEMRAAFEVEKSKLLNQYKIKMMKKQLQHKLDSFAGSDVDLDGMEEEDEEFASLLR
jgi:hypothetical protein